MSHVRVPSIRPGHRNIPSLPIDIHSPHTCVRPCGPDDDAMRHLTAIPLIAHRHSLSPQTCPIVRSSRPSDETSDGTAPTGRGTLVPVVCPRRFPRKVPSPFRGVLSTRMRHEIGQQPVNDPLSANPVDRQRPERPVPFSDRCPIAWATVRTSGLPAQNGPQASCSKTLPSRTCHTPLRDADNGTRIGIR